MARRTGETVKCFNRLFLAKRTNHEALPTTLAPRFLFRVGKILIYVINDCHKLQFIGITFKMPLLTEHDNSLVALQTISHF